MSGAGHVTTHSTPPTIPHGIGDSSVWGCQKDHPNVVVTPKSFFDVSALGSLS